jgi:hypothetical protein
VKKLYILSYGLHPGQATLETLAALRECGEVHTHCLEGAAKNQFSRFARRIVCSPGHDRKGAAEAAVKALARHDTVGFLTYGNPLFLNRTAEELILAARGKAEVRVFAAVSSFDGLVNMFNLNKFSPAGLRVADTAALLHAPVFTPEMDTLFFVPYALNLPGNESCRAAFAAGLKAAYPPAAPVYLAECGAVSEKDKAVKGRVSGIAALLARVNEKHTLFVPAVRKAGRHNDKKH